MSDSSLVSGVLGLLLRNYQNSHRYMPGAGGSKAPEGLGSFQPLASPAHPVRQCPLGTHLLVHLELLLAVTEHVLDEILQLPRQLQVAECQLVRRDTEDLPEWSEGPGDRQGHTQDPAAQPPKVPSINIVDICSGTYYVLGPAKHQHIIIHLIPTATIQASSANEHQS